MEPTQSIVSLQNSLRTKLEAQFKASAASDSQRSVCQYLKYLRDAAYSRLLQDIGAREDRNIIVGELRSIQKLLNVLELRRGTADMYYTNEPLILDSASTD